MSSRRSDYYQKYRKYKSKYLHLLQSGGGDQKPCPGYPGPCPEGATISEDSQFCPNCVHRMNVDFGSDDFDTPAADPVASPKVQKKSIAAHRDQSGELVPDNWQDAQKLEEQTRRAERAAKQRQRQREDLQRSKQFGLCPECYNYGISKAKRYERPTCTLCGFQPKPCTEEVVSGYFGHRGDRRKKTRKQTPCPNYAEIGTKCYPHSRAGRNTVLRRDGTLMGDVSIDDKWLKPEHQP